MADVKGQVDWQALADEELESSAKAFDGLESMSTEEANEVSEMAFADWLRTTFEPIVKAAEPLKAFIAKFDERARAGLDDVLYSVDGDMDNGIKVSDLRALRAALDGLPKVGG